MKKLLRLTLLSTLIIGPLATVVLKVFEFVAIEGTVWWWNDLWHADENWWGAIPLAVGGGLLYGGLLHASRQRRVPEPATDPMAAHDSPGSPTLGNMGMILLTGAASLTLAGASLGPEAPLMAFATVLGLWVASHAKLDQGSTRLLALASVGALLVAFLGSIVPVLLPVLILAQQAKLPWKQPRTLWKRLRDGWRTLVAILLPVVGAAAAAFVTLWLIDPSVKGYGNIPVGLHMGWRDFVLAPLVGVLATGFGWALKTSITTLGRWVTVMEAKIHWAVFAAVVALGIGVLYAIGGPSVRFSGSVGTQLLVHDAPALGLGALAVLLVIKLLVTAWSMATGYRGGLVFPSIYVGVAIALIIGALFGVTDPGVMLGAVAGVFGAMTGAAVAFIFIAAVIPPTAGMWVLALLAIAGATLASRWIDQITRVKR